MGKENVEKWDDLEKQKNADIAYAIAEPARPGSSTSSPSPQFQGNQVTIQAVFFGAL